MRTGYTIIQLVCITWVLLAVVGCLSSRNGMPPTSAVGETSNNVVLGRFDQINVTTLVYPFSWIDTEYTDGDAERLDFEGAQHVVYTTCDALQTVATYYIRTLYTNGWSRVADTSFLVEGLGGPRNRWGGIFAKGKCLMSIDCRGYWFAGTLTKDGKFVEPQRWPNRIRVAAWRGSLNSILGEDWAKQRLPLNVLLQRVREYASADRDSLERYYGRDSVALEGDRSGVRANPRIDFNLRFLEAQTMGERAARVDVGQARWTGILPNKEGRPWTYLDIEQK